MSKYYNKLSENVNGAWVKEHEVFGKHRGNQPTDELNNHFDQVTLYFLSEKVINHLADSLTLDLLWKEQFKDRFNDFSFFTAPSYKAFEGFLFQIAKDMQLPSSGNPNFAGTYFDEEKVDKTIDKLIKELEQKTQKEPKLTKEEKIHIKDMIQSMKRFLYHYRHTPAHFHGEAIDTLDKARQNVLSMYRIINETTKTLLKANLIRVKDIIH